MVQTDLWDGLVPTKNRFMQRTLAWGTTNPSIWPDDAWFMNTTDKEILQWQDGKFTPKIINENTFQAYSMVVG